MSSDEENDPQPAATPPPAATPQPAESEDHDAPEPDASGYYYRDVEGEKWILAPLMGRFFDPT